MRRNSTHSLYDSDVVYYDIHGRRYCKQYGMPNDEDEQLRMHLLNDIYYVLLGQRLTTVPLVNPRKILDIGTGIGEWAMAMGDHFPNAEVIGTDIAKIQPTSEPVNVFFELEDAEQEGGWTWADDEFDFIHFRYLCGAFTSWTSIYKEAYRHLKPGGWIEVLDFDDRAAPAHDVFENTEIIAWVTELMESSRRSGRPRSVTHMESSCLEELGFVDVQSTVIEIPVGVWHEDEQVQKNGKHFLVMVLLGLEAVCLRPLTEQMGWTPDRVRETCEFVARELWKIASDPDVSQGFGFKLKILVGRKPGGPEAEASQDPNSSRPVTADESAAGESSLSGEETPEESASGA
jgi:SAM-dependent methyltransferase